MKKHIKTLLIVTSLLTLLISCKSTAPGPISDWDKELDLEVKIVEIPETDQQEVEKVQYLARNLMGTEQREEYTQHLLKEEVSTWDMTSVGAGFAGSTMMTGNPFSAGGASNAAAITMAVDVATFFMDGSADDIAQMWMPEKSEEGEVYTAETATRDARKIMTDSIFSTFKEYGYKIRCVSLCEKLGTFRFYVATITNEAKANLKAKGYTYVPVNIQIKAFLNPLFKKGKEDLIENLALGFKPAFWSGYNAFVVEIQGDIVANVNGGGQMIRYSDVEGLYGYKTINPMMKSQLGRDLMRDISKGIPWVSGTDNRSKGAGKNIVFNGKIYEWSIARSSRFIDAEVKK